MHTIRKVKFLSKYSILTKPQHFHEFFAQFFLTIFLVKSKLSTAKKSKTTTFSRVFHPKIDNFLGKSKLNFWTKNEDFEQCASIHHSTWGARKNKGRKKGNQERREAWEGRRCFLLPITAIFLPYHPHNIFLFSQKRWSPLLSKCLFSFCHVQIWLSNNRKHFFFEIWKVVPRDII